MAVEKGYRTRQSLSWRSGGKVSPCEDGVFALKDRAAPRGSARINSAKLAQAPAFLCKPLLSGPPLSGIGPLARVARETDLLDPCEAKSPA